MKVGAFCISLPAALLAGCAGGSSSVAQLTTTQPTCQTEASWSSEPSGDITGEAATPSGIRVYVDVSQPMGGYLPPKAGESSELQRMLGSLHEVMGHEYGLSDQEHITWWTVAEGAAATERQRLLTRGAYRGGSSNLTPVLSDALERVVRGEIRAAALVTDLVATGDRTGGGEASAALRAWLSSNQARSGRYGVGLLGVRATYYGADGRGCQAPPGLGCRFSEELKQWIALDQVARVPFYVVVLGADVDVVDRIGQQLASDMAPAETRWDLLNAAARTPRVGMSCDFRRSLPGQSEPVLPPTEVILVEGALSCLESADVRGRCQLTSDRPALPPRSVESSWGSAGAPVEVLEGNQLAVVLRCGALGDNPSARQPLSVSMSLDPSAGATDWSAWSTSSDAGPESIGRTLNLRYFTDALKIRPASWTATCVDVAPALRGGG